MERPKDRIRDQSSVSKIIDDLKTLYSRDSAYVSIIKNRNLLISALEELDSLIEMDNVKESIVQQLQFLIIKQIMNDSENPFEGHMLHTVINGPPGTGKTKIGIVLTKIWMALGIIKKSDESMIKNLDAPVIIINKMYEKTVADLTHHN